jgi:hypothetical protein
MASQLLAGHSKAGHSKGALTGRAIRNCQHETPCAGQPQQYVANLCAPVRLLMSFSTACTTWVACLQLPA